MIGLTQAQAELLAYIEKYLQENSGVAPSFEEMKQAIGLASKSGVHRLISALEEKGRIRRMHNRVRALEVLDEPAELPPLAQYPTQHLIAELARRSEARREVMAA